MAFNEGKAAKELRHLIFIQISCHDIPSVFVTYNYFVKTLSFYSIKRYFLKEKFKLPELKLSILVSLMCTIIAVNLFKQISSEKNILKAKMSESGKEEVLKNATNLRLKNYSD